MSQIPFVTELGDALEQAITASEESATARRRPRLPRLPRGRGRLIVVLAVFVIGGGAAAASLFTPSATTTLAARGLSCITPNVDSYNVPQHGETPQVACSPLIGLPAAKLIACADPQAGVFVYAADGDPNQCESENMTPLPANYEAANTQVNALENELERIYLSSDCIPPATLASDVSAALVRRGFVGWRVVIQRTTSGYAGPCGAYPGSGSAISDPTSALDAGDHTVMIVPGAPRSLDVVIVKAQTALSTASGSQCYTVPALEQEVQNVLNTDAGHAVPVTFASYPAQPGAQAEDGRQHFYEQGCPIVVSLGTAPDGRTVQVLLWDKNSSAPSASDAASGIVPQSAYQPAPAGSVSSGPTPARR